MLLIKMTLAEWFTGLSHCTNQMPSVQLLDYQIYCCNMLRGSIRAILQGFLYNLQNEVKVFTSLETTSHQNYNAFYRDDELYNTFLSLIGPRCLTQMHDNCFFEMSLCRSLKLAELISGTLERKSVGCLWCWKSPTAKMQCNFSNGFITTTATVSDMVSLNNKT